jgi:hypothetical protein
LLAIFAGPEFVDSHQHPDFCGTRCPPIIIGSLFVGAASRDPLAANGGEPPTGNTGCVGIATGGGDDPGLNALMRALRKLLSSKHHWKVSPIPDGFDGLLWPEKSLELTLDRVSRILPRGGTILGTTNRGNPFKYKSEENGREVERDISDDILANCKKLGIDAIVTIGCDGSQKEQKIGHELFQKGMKIVRVPRTIGNDLSVTDFTFGFDTALRTVRTPSTRSTPARRRVTASGRGSHGP